MSTETGAESETETAIASVTVNVNVSAITVSPTPENDRAAVIETENVIVNTGSGAEKKGKRIVCRRDVTNHSGSLLFHKLEYNFQLE